MIPKMNEYKARWQLESEDSIKPGLEAIQQALEKVGNPERSLKIIHVTGTNGKGSTIAFMEALLAEHRYTTGVFTSPAMVDIHDQIRIGGKPVSAQQLDKTFQTMKEAGLSGMLTDFELLTVAAFITFAREKPQYVLVETGMGGLLDSTNVVMPLVSVITSIALDHGMFLGTTLAEVAKQKAGIIKPRIPVVIGTLPAEAMQVVQAVAQEKESELLVYGEQFQLVTEEMERFIGKDMFRWQERKMRGAHQARNLALAIEALLTAGVPLKESDVREAVRSVQVRYRFEEISPNVFLDGAHNPAAAQALADTIRTEFPGEKMDFVIGMLKGKDIGKTIEALVPVAASFTFLTFPHPEAATGEELMASCPHPIKRVTSVSDSTIILVNDNKKIVTGSLYLLASLFAER